MVRIKGHPLLWFFILSYAISWPAWVLEARDFTWANFPGYFGPAIAALMVVATTKGRAGVEDIFSRLFLWQVPLRWYLIVIFLPLRSILLFLFISS